MTAWTPLARRRDRALLLAGILSLCCSGCASFGTPHHHRKEEPVQYGAIDPNQSRELQMVSMPPHVVEPPDELEVLVRPATDDLTPGTLTVQPDGNLDLGFAGDVYVAGLTLEQVEHKIVLQLTAKAGAKKPDGGYQVSVKLVNGTHSKSFYVLGTVGTQGKFPLTGNETVLDAILQAGLKSYSTPEKAYLVRPHPVGGPDQVLAIDWFGIKDRGDTLTNYQIFPGDRIIVPGHRPPSTLSTLLGR